MISEILYFVFVFPLESILGFGLERIFGIVKSYGLSIIILSLFVNIFLLKIFILTDKKAEFESARKKRLDSRIKAWKSVYKKAKLFAFTQTLYRQNHYHPIFALSALGGLAVQIPFFYAMYFVVKNATLSGESFLWISDLSSPDSVFGIHLLPILMTAISLVNVWIVAKEKGAKIQGIVIALIFLVLLYQMPSALVLYWTSNMAFSLIRAICNSSLTRPSREFGKSLLDRPQVLSRSDFPAQPTNLTQDIRIAECVDSSTNDSADSSLRGDSQLYRNISIYAIFCIAFLICVFTPYQLYNTDITQFDSTQTYSTLSALFGAFMLFSFMAIYALSFIPKRFAKIPAFIFSLVLFIGLIYSFILMGDYGAMDHFILQRTPFDNRDALIVKAREFVAVVAIGLIFIALALKKLLYLWQIILITLFIVSAVNAFQIIDKRFDSNKVAHESQSNDKTKPPYEDELFSYSKTHKNIVIIVLDAFSGSHTKHIFTQFPHLKTALDGFTHFPNTLSSSIATISSIATLIGGEYYTTYNMNKRKENLAKQIDSAFISTANAFAKGDFSVSLMAFVGSDIKNIAPHLEKGIFVLNAGSRAFDEFYMERENLLDKVASAKANTQSAQVALLLNFGIFRFVPEFPLRAKVYNEGKWLLDKKRKKTLDTTTAISYASSFYTLSRIVSVDSAKPTFKYFHSMMTHSPQGAYFDGDKCVFFDSRSAWDNYAHEVSLKYKDEQHYDAEACALHYLADFVGTLKNLGIYENTQIFVISDHGVSDSINMPVEQTDALFLFKDFGAKGAICVDNRLMANYDIATIFCANLKGGCPNVGQNILRHYPANREIIIAIAFSHLLELHKPNRWLFSEAYKVSGDIYNAKNWVDISDESYGIVNAKK